MEVINNYFSKKNVISVIQNLDTFKYAIMNNYRYITITNIKSLQEIEYIINWLKENSVVSSIVVELDYPVMIEQEYSLDNFPKEYFSKELDDDRIIFIEHNYNNYLDIKITRGEMIDYSAEYHVAFNFDKIFRMGLKNKYINSLTEYIIKEFYNTDKIVVCRDKEECADFINYCLNNLSIINITFIEPLLEPMLVIGENTNIIKNKLLNYCKIKKYKRVFAFEGNNDTKCWIFTDDIDKIKKGNIVYWNDISNKFN